MNNAMITIYDKIRPLNDQLTSAMYEISNGIRLDENSMVVSDIDKYLKSDVESGIIHKTDNGFYETTFCEYCREIRGELHRPIMFSYTSNIGNSVWKRWYDEFKDNLSVPKEQELFLNGIIDELKKNGMPRNCKAFDLINHFDGTFYVMCCPKCNTCYGFWRDNISEARNNFEEYVIKEIKRAKSDSEEYY